MILSNLTLARLYTSLIYPRSKELEDMQHIQASNNLRYKVSRLKSMWAYSFYLNQVKGKLYLVQSLNYNIYYACDEII